MNIRRTVVVTGAASGVGRAIALAMKAQGLSVFGTSRAPQTSPGTPDFPIVPLDVRSDESVRIMIEEIRSRAGRLDVLINNAGIRFLGAAEETSVAEAQTIFETNLFGVHRVTIAALPLLREAGDGRIVNISSLSGLNALPFAALYSASKWALEGYSESLRHELKQFGISVSVVEPGVIRSEGRQSPLRPDKTIPAYAAAERRAHGVILRGDQTGMDADRVARCVIGIVLSPSPKLRYRVGKDAEWLPRLKWLPWSLYEGGIRRRYGLDVVEGGPRST